MMKIPAITLILLGALSQSVDGQALVQTSNASLASNTHSMNGSLSDMISEVPNQWIKEWLSEDGSKEFSEDGFRIIIQQQLDGRFQLICNATNIDPDSFHWQIGSRQFNSILVSNLNLTEGDEITLHGRLKSGDPSGLFSKTFKVGEE